MALPSKDINFKVEPIELRAEDKAIDAVREYYDMLIVRCFAFSKESTTQKLRKETEWHNQRKT